MPHKFEWIEMEIAKNREEYGLIKTDLSKQKIGVSNLGYFYAPECQTYMAIVSYDNICIPPF